MIAVLALMKCLSRGEGSDVVVVVRLSKAQDQTVKACDCHVVRATEVTNQTFPLRRYSCPCSSV
jgi:hypothetical protein